MIAELSPCPFCGAPQDGDQTDHYRLHGNYLQPRMDGKPSALMSFEIRHWCRPVGGLNRRMSISIVGRDRDDAVRQWNARTEDKA